MIGQQAGGWGVSMASGGSETHWGAPVRELLLDLLAEHAYQYDPSKPFQLASGEQSAEYIDCKNALSFPQAMAGIGELFYSEVLPSVQAIGGLTMGADPIAHSVSQYSSGTTHPLRWFTVRKEPKKHGLMRDIEGGVPAMTNVAVVDDVVTWGTSTLDAISKCQLASYNVMQVIVLVDRQQGGLDKIKSEVPSTVPVKVLFTKAEIHDRWERLRARRR